MGKGKKRKSSDNFHKKPYKRPNNPFEEQIGNEKQQVLGRQLKTAKGAPGKSRAYARDKRKHTLLPEYEQQHKSNSIFDHRIGEQNRFITQEEKTVARYTAVRSKRSKQIFNLGGDEILTHNGRTLSEIEKFEDPRSDEDDDDEYGNSKNGGKLDRDFVNEAHFGGGVLRKSTDQAKSYKDIINQLITDSKKRKMEKQKQKESTMELTEKLDSEWTDIMPLINKLKGITAPAEPVVSNTPVDKYDKYVKELRFEARGIPSDKLKTTAEIAEEEKKNIQVLEQERLIRMRGTNNSSIPVHRSADDLDDNFNFNEDNDVTLSYNAEGVANFDLPIESTDLNIGENAESVELEEECVVDETSDNEESDDSESEKSDNYSDLTDDKDELLDNVEDFVEDVESNTIDEVKYEINAVNLDSKNEDNDDYVSDHESLQSFPETYEDFQLLLNGISCKRYDKTLNRLIYSCDPKVSAKNVDKLGLLLVYLLQYIKDLKIKNDPFKKCVCITPAIFELIRLNMDDGCNSILEVLKEIKTEFNEKNIPTINMLMYLRIIGSVFSVSDFRHLVCTPALILMEDMLAKLVVKSKYDVFTGLFLVSLMLEFTLLSKRFSPGAVNFLKAIIYSAIPTSEEHLKNKVSLRVTKGLLALSKNCSKVEVSTKLDASDLSRKKGFIISEDFKVTALYVALKLLQDCHEQLSTISSSCEIFEDFAKYLSQISPAKYPQELRQEVSKVQEILKVQKAQWKLEYLSMEKKRPKPLRLYEPNIQKIYDRKPYGVQSREKTERDKLIYKIKQEKKGALREIRKDISFLGRHRIHQQIKSDDLRKEKVKRIYAEASIQQSDLNKLKRKK